MAKRIHLALFAGAILASPAIGADTPHVALQIKPGLWEFTDMPKVTGDTIIADTMLAHVTAGQRAQFVADARKEIAAPHKARECFTQAKFEQRVSLNSIGCARAVVSNTPARLDIRSVCRGEGQGIRENTTQEIVVSSPAQATTTTHAVSMRGGKTMTIDATETGRWLSAECHLGGVIQQLP